MRLPSSFGIGLVTILVAACATIEPIPFYKPAAYSFIANFGLSAAAFAPGGRLAAVANFNTIWVLETSTMKTLSVFSGHDRFGTNNTLVFLDDERIATTAQFEQPGTGGIQAAVKIWKVDDANAAPTVIALPELGRYAISLGRSDATGALAAGGYNGAVVVLMPDDHGRFMKIALPGLDGPVLGLAFDQNGTMLAAGGVDSSIPVWDLQALTEIGSLPADDTVFDLDLVPGAQALVVTGKDLRVWKFQSAASPTSLDNPSLAGDYVVIGGLWATLTVLAAATAALGGYAPLPSMTAHEPHEPEYGFCARETAVSPDGRIISDVHSGKLKEKIRIMDLERGAIIKKLDPAGGHTCGVVFSPDSSKLLLANHRGAFLYDTKTWAFENFDLGASCTNPRSGRKPSCVID